MNYPLHNEKKTGNWRHGGRHTRLYNIWRSMRQRCSNPHVRNFSNYGKRGITVCDEWNDFITFREWALRTGYNDTLTIDRIDVNGNYDPSNCRWSSYKAQANNKTTTQYYEYNGVVHTLSEWSDIVGVRQATLWYRIKKLKWSIERTLTTPAKKGNNQYADTN